MKNIIYFLLLLPSLLFAQNSRTYNEYTFGGDITTHETGYVIVSSPDDANGDEILLIYLHGLNWEHVNGSTPFKHRGVSMGQALHHHYSTGEDQRFPDSLARNIVIAAPQKNGSQHWDYDDILEAYHYVVDTLGISVSDTIAIGGESWGGGGTVKVTYEWANEVSPPFEIGAAIPIASVNPVSAANYAARAGVTNVPHWFFHLNDDPQVSEQNTVDYVNALRDAGMTLTEDLRVTIWNYGIHKGWNTVIYNDSTFTQPFPRNTSFFDGGVGDISANASDNSPYGPADFDIYGWIEQQITAPNIPAPDPSITVRDSATVTADEVITRTFSNLDTAGVYTLVTIGDNGSGTIVDRHDITIIGDQGGNGGGSVEQQRIYANITRFGNNTGEPFTVNRLDGNPTTIATTALNNDAGNASGISWTPSHVTNAGSSNNEAVASGTDDNFPHTLSGGITRELDDAWVTNWKLSSVQNSGSDPCKYEVILSGLDPLSTYDIYAFFTSNTSSDFVGYNRDMRVTGVGNTTIVGNTVLSADQPNETELSLAEDITPDGNNEILLRLENANATGARLMECAGVMIVEK